MARAAGFCLRLFQTLIYFLALCCSAIVLGIFSYFLASLSHNNEYIAPRYKAVEGMSGIACIYTICAVIFTLCLGGMSFFAFIAIVLDLCFVGAFVAIAYYTRGGAGSCNGYVNTPLGSGFSGQTLVNGHHIRNICRLETACFAVAVIAAFLFLVAAFLQLGLARHHQNEKRYGPSPANNYTTGSARTSFWKRGRRNNMTTRDAEMATAGAGVNNRISHDTGYTGSTQAAPGEVKYGEPGYYRNTTATNY